MYDRMEPLVALLVETRGGAKAFNVLDNMYEKVILDAIEHLRWPNICYCKEHSTKSVINFILISCNQVDVLERERVRLTK